MIINICIPSFLKFWKSFSKHTEVDTRTKVNEKFYFQMSDAQNPSVCFGNMGLMKNLHWKREEGEGWRIKLNELWSFRRVSLKKLIAVMHCFQQNGIFLDSYKKKLSKICFLQEIIQWSFLERSISFLRLFFNLL